MKTIPYLSSILPAGLGGVFNSVTFWVFLVQYSIGAFCIYQTVGCFLEIKKNSVSH